MTKAKQSQTTERIKKVSDDIRNKRENSSAIIRAREKNKQKHRDNRIHKKKQEIGKRRTPRQTQPPPTTAEIEQQTRDTQGKQKRPNKNLRPTTKVRKQKRTTKEPKVITQKKKIDKIGKKEKKTKTAETQKTNTGKDQFVDIAIQIGNNQTRKDASSISEAYHNALS